MTEAFKCSRRPDSPFLEKATPEDHVNAANSACSQYDELNRIHDAVTDATSGQFCWGQLFGTQSGSTFTSGYDPWGNLKTITPDPNRPGCCVNILGKTINAYNKIVDTGYSYDADGNMTADPSLSYSYDVENQLTTTGDRSPLPGGGNQPVGGGASGTPSEGFARSFSVVQADPSKMDSGDLSGVFLGKDGSISTGQIPGADEGETAAHELLGHVWAKLIGGQSAIVGGQGNAANLREALIAEDRVRNTDPARVLKIRHQDSGQLIRTSDLPRIRNPGSQP